MKKQNIQKLIERYLEADTTLEEEHLLYEYFKGNDIPEELLPYAKMFREYAAIADKSNLVKEKPKQKTIPIWSYGAIAAACAVIALLFFFPTKEDVSTGHPTIAKIENTKVEVVPNNLEIKKSDKVEETKNTAALNRPTNSESQAKAIQKEHTVQNESNKLIAQTDSSVDSKVAIYDMEGEEFICSYTEEQEVADEESNIIDEYYTSDYQDSDFIYYCSICDDNSYYISEITITQN
ncbi:MAG: hypothetical protein K6E54_01635 [Bacteroidaceae bacterium]|nr:hypothetical protein [Bacteroidaceae bacterium]